MADTCCGPTPTSPSTDTADSPPVDDTPQRLWQVHELQCAAAAAIILTASWLLGRTGADPVATIGGLLAAAIAAATFVPSTLRNLRHGRIGVGTLLTIALIGAIALAQTLLITHRTTT